MRACNAESQGYLVKVLQDKGHALNSCHRRYPAVAALKAVPNGTGAALGSPHRSMAALLVPARTLAASLAFKTNLAWVGPCGHVARSITKSLVTSGL